MNVVLESVENDFISDPSYTWTFKIENDLNPTEFIIMSNGDIGFERNESMPLKKFLVFYESRLMFK